MKKKTIIAWAIFIVYLIGIPASYNKIKTTTIKRNIKYEKAIAYSKNDKFQCVILSAFSWISYAAYFMVEKDHQWRNEPA